MSTIFYVNVYTEDRAYGGPEEGGWWYNFGVFQACAFSSRDRDEAEAFADNYNLKEEEAENGSGGSPSHYDINSVACIGIFRACVEEQAGADWPEETPYYE